METMNNLSNVITMMNALNSIWSFKDRPTTPGQTSREVKTPFGGVGGGATKDEEMRVSSALRRSEGRGSGEQEDTH